MPDIIYISGEQMAGVVSTIGQAVAGQSSAETAAALGGQAYGGSIVSFPIQYSKDGWYVHPAVSSALATWDLWKAQAAATGTTVLGAAAAGALAWGQGVLFGNPETVGTLAGAGGLLNMSLPAAGAAFAPLLGVSLGATLYQSNPELWTKISQTLLPFCYEDTGVMPVVFDAVTNMVYAPGRALAALKNLFIQEGIGGSTEEFTPPAGYDVQTPIYYRTVQNGLFSNPEPVDNDWKYISDLSATAPVYFCPYYNSNYNRVNYTFASKEPFSFYHGRSAGSHTSFVSGVLQGVGPFRAYRAVNTDTLLSNFQNNFTGFQISAPQEIGYVDATIITVAGGTEGGYYPEGTSEWEGDVVDYTQTDPIYPVVSPSGAIEPYYPITLPVGDPTVSNDPLIQPDPIAPVEYPQLDPFISPATPNEMWPDFPSELEPTPGEKVAPQAWTDPMFVPAPNLNPNIDPSAEPALDPAEKLPDIEAPTSSGLSPSPYFPAPGVPFPSIVPTNGPGLIHVYNPTPSEFISFGRWLWVTWADVSISSIEKIWNNPFDGVIGAFELYATPTTDGTDTIKSGFLDSGISSAIVRQRYIEVDCGSMVIPEYFGNYLDYSPYCKAYIYLPFIGIVEVDVDDIVGHAINILYHVDTYNGSCIAQVTVARDNYSNTIYQFSGNCSVEIPMAGGSQAAIKGAMMSAAAYGIGSTVSGIISGGMHKGVAGAIAGGLGGAISGAANGFANVVSQKSTVQHSGSFGASYGAMGIKKPYIIIRRPIQKEVVNYQNDYGFPAHKRVLVGECTGFLRVREVNVQSSLATDEEKREIEQLLKSGVYVT